jgi:hypothetical protein
MGVQEAVDDDLLAGGRGGLGSDSESDDEDEFFDAEDELEEIREECNVDVAFAGVGRCSRGFEARRAECSVGVE